jgi:ABC-2 type transport system ATP-binding protein
VVKNPLAIRQISGVLPEDLGLFDDLTVEEHLMLTGRIYGLNENDTQQRTTELLRALNLTHGRNTFAAQCSHGMRKKTAFAMALLPNPEVLFLDEPFEAIDPVTGKLMRDLLVTLSQRGVTIFLTSHILSVVERIATQFVIIRGGACVWNSSAAELPRSLEDLYFELAESANMEPLEWLGSRSS